MTRTLAKTISNLIACSALASAAFVCNASAGEARIPTPKNPDAQQDQKLNDRGGTDMLPRAFANNLKSKPRMGCKVVRIEQTSQGATAFFVDGPNRPVQRACGVNRAAAWRHRWKSIRACTRHARTWKAPRVGVRLVRAAIASRGWFVSSR